MNIRCFAGTALTMLGLAGTCNADINYGHVRCRAETFTMAVGVQCQHMVDAEKPGPFDLVSECRSDAEFGGYSTATSTFTGELLGDAIIASGVSSGTWSRISGSMGAYQAVAGTSMDITFDVPADAQYTLALRYSLGDGPFFPPGPYFTLSGPPGFQGIARSEPALDVQLAGDLPAGTYHLTSEVRRNASFPVLAINVSIDVELRITGQACPADFNADGAANSQDFFDFLNAFFTNDPRADVNADGFVNSQDFFEFIPVFFAGC